MNWNASLVPQVVATLLVAFRIAPTFAFAPPFTLLRIPATVRVLLALAIAGWLTAANPAATSARLDANALVPIALAELGLGIGFALVLQLTFAAIQLVGRMLDIQAGFGLATLIDPATRAQVPLIGTVFAYCAAAVFFATDGPAALLAVWSASIEHVPLGASAVFGDPATILAFFATVSVMALGLGGLVLLVLLTLDVAVALLSRTMPQMNMLVLGFQVKVIATFITLPVAIGLSGALYVRLLETALEAMTDLT